MARIGGSTRGRTASTSARDWLDLRGLLDAVPVHLEGLDGLEAIGRIRGDQFPGDSPADPAFHPAEAIPDGRPSESEIDHLLPDGLERDRPELGGRCVTVQLPHESESSLDVLGLASRLAIGAAVTLLCVFPVGQDQFPDS